jgi:tRNA G18 (ribose-2'-O)-methylase SpoU
MYNERSDGGSVMPLHRLVDLSSPRLDSYRNLRTTNLTRQSGRFIAESKPLVQRLVASGWSLDSVLVDARYLDEALTWLPPEADILVVSGEQVSELIGFSFHRGFLACGIRPEMLRDESILADGGPDWMGVMLVGVQDPENMGSIFRTCAALGISDILLGPQCVDPFARRVLRVSMGNAFKLRFFEIPHAAECLVRLATRGIESVAACLDDGGQDLSRFDVRGPTLVVFGNEAHGLPAEVKKAAGRYVQIEMALGTDSLNVSVAAGIILHHLRRVCARS